MYRCAVLAKNFHEWLTVSLYLLVWRIRTEWKSPSDFYWISKSDLSCNIYFLQEGTKLAKKYRSPPKIASNPLPVVRRNMGDSACPVIGLYTNRMVVTQAISTQARPMTLNPQL